MLHFDKLFFEVRLLLWLQATSNTRKSYPHLTTTSNWILQNRSLNPFTNALLVTTDLRYCILYLSLYVFDIVFLAACLETLDDAHVYQVRPVVVSCWLLGIINIFL